MYCSQHERYSVHCPVPLPKTTGSVQNMSRFNSELLITYVVTSTAYSLGHMQLDMPYKHTSDFKMCNIFVIGMNAK